MKAAALTAFGADEAGQKIFPSTGLVAAKRQDQQDAIDADNQKTQAEKDRIAAPNARQNAATVVSLPTDDTVLDLPDDFFIRKLLERAVPGSEVAAAAQTALNSSNRADWKAYIATGIFAANQRDIDIAKAKKVPEDRRITRELKAKAENGLMGPRLVAAATAELAGSDADVAVFLKDGQYAVGEQSIEATTPGNRGTYVRSAGGDAVISQGDAGTNGSAPLDAATWRVKDGLADPNCFSLESTQFEGSYLRVNGVRVQLAANDGSTAFENDATWCSSLGHNGPGVPLESKAQPGRFLRHWGGQLFAANSSRDEYCDSNWLFQEDTTWTIVDPNPQVSTPITLRWTNDDAFHAAVGEPKGDEVYDSFNGGVRYRDFTNGRAYWDATNGAHYVLGATLEKYKSVGQYRWLMPVEDTLGTGDGVGTYTHFAGGASIYWTPSTGAHLVYGAIRMHWAQLGWEKSCVGYPTADEAQVGNLRRNTFHHGNIDHDPATGRTWDYKV